MSKGTSDSQHCVVSVLGYVSHGKVFKSSSDGTGKSCLCCRLTHPAVDDYINDHPSLLALHEFESKVVCTDSFLFWGTKELEFPSKGKSEGKPSTVNVEVVEHTLFYHDETSRVFPRYSKLHDPDKYTKQALIPPDSSRKISYYARDCIGFPDRYRCLPYPSNVNRLPRGFIIVCDVSVKQPYFEAHLVATEQIAHRLYKDSKLPFIVAATKRDSADSTSLQRLHDWASKKKITVIETSAKQNINIKPAFMHIVSKILKASKLPSSVTSYADAIGDSLLHTGKVRQTFQTFLGKKVRTSNFMLSSIESAPEYIETVEILGKFVADEIYAKHLLSIRDSEVRGYQGVLENPDMRMEMLEQFVEDISLELAAHKRTLKSLINVIVSPDDIYQNGGTSLSNPRMPHSSAAPTHGNDQPTPASTKPPLLSPTISSEQLYEIIDDLPPPVIDIGTIEEEYDNFADLTNSKSSSPSVTKSNHGPPPPKPERAAKSPKINKEKLLKKPILPPGSTSPKPPKKTSSVERPRNLEEDKKVTEKVEVFITPPSMASSSPTSSPSMKPKSVVGGVSTSSGDGYGMIRPQQDKNSNNMQDSDKTNGTKDVTSGQDDKQEQQLTKPDTVQSRPYSPLIPQHLLNRKSPAPSDPVDRNKLSELPTYKDAVSLSPDPSLGPVTGSDKPVPGSSPIPSPVSSPIQKPKLKPKAPPKPPLKNNGEQSPIHTSTEKGQTPVPENGQIPAPKNRQTPVPMPSDNGQTPVPTSLQKGQSPILLPALKEQTPVPTSTPQTGQTKGQTPILGPILIPKGQSPALPQKRQSPTRTNKRQSPVLPHKGQSPVLPQKGQTPVPTPTQNGQSPVLPQKGQSPVLPQKEQTPVPTITQNGQSPVLTQKEQSPVLPQKGQTPIPTPTQNVQSPVLPQKGQTPVPKLGQISVPPLPLKAVDPEDDIYISSSLDVDDKPNPLPIPEAQPTEPNTITAQPLSSPLPRKEIINVDKTPPTTNMTPPPIKAKPGNLNSSSDGKNRSKTMIGNYSPTVINVSKTQDSASSGEYKPRLDAIRKKLAKDKQHSVPPPSYPAPQAPPTTRESPRVTPKPSPSSSITDITGDSTTNIPHSRSMEINHDPQSGSGPSSPNKRGQYSTRTLPNSRGKVAHTSAESMFGSPPPPLPPRTPDMKEYVLEQLQEPKQEPKQIDRKRSRTTVGSNMLSPDKEKSAKNRKNYSNLMKKTFRSITGRGDNTINEEANSSSVITSPEHSQEWNTRARFIRMDNRPLPLPPEENLDEVFATLPPNPTDDYEPVDEFISGVDTRPPLPTPDPLGGIPMLRPPLPDPTPQLPVTITPTPSQLSDLILADVKHCFNENTSMDEQQLREFIDSRLQQYNPNRQHSDPLVDPRSTQRRLPERSRTFNHHSAYLDTTDDDGYEKTDSWHSPVPPPRGGTLDYTYPEIRGFRPNGVPSRSFKPRAQTPPNEDDDDYLNMEDQRDLGYENSDVIRSLRKGGSLDSGVVSSTVPPRRFSQGDESFYYNMNKRDHGLADDLFKKVVSITESVDDETGQSHSEEGTGTVPVVLPKKDKSRPLPPRNVPRSVQ